MLKNCALLLTPYFFLSEKSLTSTTISMFFHPAALMKMTSYVFMLRSCDRYRSRLISYWSLFWFIRCEMKILRSNFFIGFEIPDTRYWVYVKVITFFLFKRKQYTIKKKFYQPMLGEKNYIRKIYLAPTLRH